jgi:hypothetical protein
MASGKNKPKLWRRMSKKYYDKEKGVIVRPGRQLKMFTVGYTGRKQATGLLLSLINRLPDVSAVLKQYEKKVKTDEAK